MDLNDPMVNFADVTAAAEDSPPPPSLRTLNRNLVYAAPFQRMIGILHGFGWTYTSISAEIGCRGVRISPANLQKLHKGGQRRIVDLPELAEFFFDEISKEHDFPLWLLMSDIDLETARRLGNRSDIHRLTFQIYDRLESQKPTEKSVKRLERPLRMMRHGDVNLCRFEFNLDANGAVVAEKYFAKAFSLLNDLYDEEDEDFDAFEVLQIATAIERQFIATDRQHEAEKLDGLTYRKKLLSLLPRLKRWTIAANKVCPDWTKYYNLAEAYGAARSEKAVSVFKQAIFENPLLVEFDSNMLSPLLTEPISQSRHLSAIAAQLEAEEREFVRRIREKVAEVRAEETSVSQQIVKLRNWIASTGEYNENDEGVTSNPKLPSSNAGLNDRAIGGGASDILS
jgi:hypothetical protein